LSSSDASAALIDGYFLDRMPSRSALIARLLAEPVPIDAARPFYEGFRMLGARTPELSLIALRLVLGGNRADDEAVTRLRTIVDRIGAGGAQAAAARSEYRRAVGD
jgi:hypothetical protein